MNRLRKNLDVLFGELFGDSTDFPFFARLLAFLIDYAIFTIVTNIVLYASGKGAFDSYINILIFCFAFWLFYAGIANSKVCNGQTLGKRIMRVRVIDGSQRPIGIFRSLLRSIPVALLINTYLVMLEVVVYLENAFFELTVTTIVTLTIGTLYFSVVNLNRQSLHDLFVSSYVIPKGRNVEMIETNMTAGKLIVFCSLVFLVMLPFVTEWQKD